MRAIGLALLVLLLVVPAVARANAPAPWAVCAGKAPGDSCASTYYPNGVCLVADAGCPAGDGGGTCLLCTPQSGGTGGGDGCDIGAGGAAGAAAVLGLAGVVGLAWRRRRR